VSAAPVTSERLYCCDCREDVTPMPMNGEGWFFHWFAGHRVIVADQDNEATSDALLHVRVHPSAEVAGRIHRLEAEVLQRRVPQPRQGGSDAGAAILDKKQTLRRLRSARNDAEHDGAAS
jgi:hypothetical protein